MKRRTVIRRGLAGGCAVGFWLTGSALALDPAVQKLAERYETLLKSNPLQQAALDRLWQIYADQNETNNLVARSRDQSLYPPILSARILERAGNRDEARKLLSPLAEKDSAAAALVAEWWQTDGEPRKAAEVLDKAGRALSKADLLLKAAEAWNQSGELAKAQADREAALALEPLNLALRQQLGESAAAAGNTEGAILHWRVIAEKGTPPERLTALEKIEAVQEKTDHFDDAIASQEAILALLGAGHWKTAEARAKLIRLSESASRLPELESRWTAAAATDASRYQALAELYAFQGNEEKRLGALRKALAAAPRDADLLRTIAREELSLARLAGAKEALDQLLKVRPMDEDAVFLRAEIAALEGHPEEAEKRVEDFAKTRSGDAPAQERKMDFYRRLNLLGAIERTLQRANTDPAGREALIRFYLDERRLSEAIKGMENFDFGTLPEPDRARMAMRFAEWLREEHHDAEALRWARQAGAKDPTLIEAADLEAEILIAQGRKKEAEGAILKSLRSPAQPGPEPDRQLFSTLRTTASEAEAQALPNAFAVRSALDELRTQAEAGQTEYAWLRLSRWLQWSGDVAQARSTLQEALELLPKSTLLMEAMADHLGTNGDQWAAIQEWEKLATLDPKRAAEARRRIGQLRLNQKAADEAITVFRDLQREQPRSWQATADVAEAQQQAGEWFDAFDSWLAAEKLAPPEAKRTLRASILTAAAHLQLKDRALDFLEQACVTEKDTASRHDLARDAAAFAHDQNVVEAWRGRISRRASVSEGDIFWTVALAFLQQEEGRSDEALATLRGAHARNPDRLLTEALLKMSERGGNFTEAAQLTTEDSSPAAIKRANYLERAGGDAAGTWEILTVRYGRDAGVLKAAAEFYERQGETAGMERCLRSLAELKAVPPQTLLKLGRLALARGDRAAALDDFEKLLATTAPNPGSLKNALPPPRWQRSGSSNQAPEFLGTDPGESEVEGCRLLAILEVGHLISNTAGKGDWATSLTHPAERVWALAACGMDAEAVTEIRKGEALNSDDEQTLKSFSALALEAGEAKALAETANTDNWRSDLRWKGIGAALGILGRDHAPDRQTLETLVRAAPAVQRWELLRQLAKAGNPLLARELARKIPWNLTPPLATQAWLKCASWDQDLRDLDAARASYDEAIKISPSDHSYMQPLFEALRARWLLTPEKERTAFREMAMGELKKKKSLSGEAAGAALLAGLGGNYAEADIEFRKLLAAIGIGDGGDWIDTIERGGARLEQWGLPRLARALYRASIEGDAALAILRGDPMPERLKFSFVSSKLRESSDKEVSYLLNEWKAYGAPQEVQLMAARQLAAVGQTDKAIQIVRGLCEINPSSNGVLIGVLSFTYEPRLVTAFDGYVRRLLASPSYLTVRSPLANAAFRLASVYLQDGQPKAALELLELAAKNDEPEAAALSLRAQALRRLGRFQEALAVYENATPAARSTPAITLETAQLYAMLGREKEARLLIEKFLQPNHPQQINAALQLQELLPVLKDEALASRVTAALEAQSIPASTNAADLAMARQEMAKLDFQNPEAEKRFQAGLQLLYSHPNMAEELKVSELRRLARLAANNPKLESPFYMLRRNLAQMSGQADQFRAELLTEWARGKGSYYAGEILVQMALLQPQQFMLPELLDEYLTARNYRPEAWRILADRLLVLDQVAMAERVLTALGQAGGDTTSSDLLQLEVGWKQGRPDQKKLAALEQLAELEPTRHLDLARFYLRLGLASDASRHLALGKDGDANTRGELLGEAAKQLIVRGHLAEARKLFSQIANSTNTRPSPAMLAAFLETTGALPAFDPSYNEFHLPLASFHQLRTEILERMITNGRSGKVWEWLEKDPRLLDDAEMREVFRENEKGDWTRSAAIWSRALAVDPLWETQQAAALFHLRWADTLDGKNALRQLKRAHELDAGNLAIASAYVGALRKAGQTEAAEKARQQSLQAYGKPADREAIRQLPGGPATAASLPGKK